MQFEIRSQFQPRDLMAHGPLVDGGWQRPDASGTDGIVWGKFLIDSGSGNIAICDSVAKSLGLVPAKQTHAHGLSGKASLDSYLARMHIPVIETTSRRGVMFGMPVDCQGIPDLSESHAAYHGVNVIGLIGRTFLQFAKLEIDGESGSVRLVISEGITRPRP